MTDEEIERQSKIIGRILKKNFTKYCMECEALNIEPELVSRAVMYNGIYIMLDTFIESEGSLKKAIRKSKKYIKKIADKIESETVKTEF